MKTVELDFSKGRKRGFFWRVKSQNGRILLTSEVYNRRPYKVIENYMADLRRGTARFVDMTDAKSKAKSKAKAKR